MKKLLVIVALLSLAVPAAYAAPPAGKGKPESPGKSASAPGQSADKNAAKKCKALRKNDPARFEELYGDKPNALGKCVSQTNAAKECKAERAKDPEAFKEKYGTNANGANAFGKCVSKHARGETTTTS